MLVALPGNVKQQQHLRTWILSRFKKITVCQVLGCTVTLSHERRVSAATITLYKMKSK